MVLPYSLLMVCPVISCLSDLDSRGQRHHRHRYFRKSRGSAGVKGVALPITMPTTYGGPAPSGLPPRFQPSAHPRPPPPPSPGAISYDPYAPPHHHPTARPPRYGAARWGSDLTHIVINHYVQNLKLSDCLSLSVCLSACLSVPTCLVDSGQKLHPFPEPAPDWSTADLLPSGQTILS